MAPQLAFLLVLNIFINSPQLGLSRPNLTSTRASTRSTWKKLNRKYPFAKNNDGGGEVSELLEICSLSESMSDTTVTSPETMTKSFIRGQKYGPNGAGSVRLVQSREPSLSQQSNIPASFDVLFGSYPYCLEPVAVEVGERVLGHEDKRPTSPSEISPETFKRIQRVKKLTKRLEEMGTEILSRVLHRDPFKGSSYRGPVAAAMEASGGREKQPRKKKLLFG
ncbi:hypothetical protein C1H46_038591 [Malus baccata]|uniref:Uncharacterized protein n=1 Tax=Malus baccata TaxID=106549 RepID=A0A540KPD8_MALBA|nr:hypothetical protein C1H46_038591 [Malus baccata]